MPLSSSLFSALDFCTTVFTGHLGYYSFVSLKIFHTYLNHTDAMLPRSKTSGTLRGFFSLKCKPAALVPRHTLPVINLHSIQLCPAGRICFSSGHASVSRRQVIFVALNANVASGSRHFLPAVSRYVRLPVDSVSPRPIISLSLSISTQRENRSDVDREFPSGSRVAF
jgi:hypothetical protein